MRPQKGLWRHRRDGGGAVVGKHVKLNNFLNDNTMMRPQKGSPGSCSCQKYGMKCSLACGQCRGSACSNASPIIAQEEEDLLEEYTQ